MSKVRFDGFLSSEKLSAELVHVFRAKFPSMLFIIDFLTLDDARFVRCDRLEFITRCISDAASEVGGGLDDLYLQPNGHGLDLIVKLTR